MILNDNKTQEELKVSVKRANKLKNPTPDEIRDSFYSTLNSDGFKELQNKLFSVSLDEEKEARPKKDITEDIIQSQIKALQRLIKQRKYKDAIRKIRLVSESRQYPFPADVFIEIGGISEKLDFELIKPKELHYMLDAMSGDFNAQYGGNTDVIDDTYNQLCKRLLEFNWGKICEISPDFSVVYESYTAV